MDLFAAIAKRYSYRNSFKKAEVDRDDLVKIVDAGIHAPSGCNAQTTEFIIVDDPVLIRRIADIVEKNFIVTAPAVIVCVVEAKAVYKGQTFEREDCSAAVENMLLAVTALGLASVWIDGALRYENRAALIAELLKVPKERYVAVLLPIGVPENAGKQREKKPFGERAYFNKYGVKE